MLGLPLFLSCASLTSCSKEENNVDKACIDGKGAIITRTLSIAEFKGIDLSIASKLTVMQGDKQEIKAIGQANIIDVIKTSIANDTWTITTKDDICISNYELSFEITVPNIDKLIISGSGNIIVKDFKNQKSLDMEIKGSGSMTLNKFEGINSLNIVSNGSGNIVANKDIASLKKLNINISGSGDYRGFPISADDNTVGITGAGKVQLTADKTLKATIAGSGNVYYKGSPTITKTVTGSGKVISAN